MVLRKNPHPNLPMLVACQDPGKGANTDDGFVFFNPVFGDLYENARVTRPFPQVMKMFRQMVRAVAHCHQHRIVLGNVKLGKFLWANQEKTIIQLADLNGSQLIKEGGLCRVSNAAGSPAYIAPEVLSEIDTYDGFAADVWSLGVVLFVLLTGRYPFEDTTSAGLFKKIKSAEISYPDNLPEPIEAFLREILVRDPSDRPTAMQVYSNDVLRCTPSTKKKPGLGVKVTTDTLTQYSASQMESNVAADVSFCPRSRTNFNQRPASFRSYSNEMDTCEKDAVVPVAFRRHRRASLQITPRTYSRDLGQGHSRPGSKRGSWCAGLDELLSAFDETNVLGSRELKRQHSMDNLTPIASLAQQLTQQQLSEPVIRGLISEEQHQRHHTLQQFRQQQLLQYRLSLN